MITIGIDIGVTGAIAVVSDAQLVEVHDMPSTDGGGKHKRRIDGHALRKLLDVIYIQHKYHGYIEAWYESLNAFPGQGVSSQFSIGRSLGMVEGVLIGIGIPCRAVSPQRWKKHFGLIEKREPGKTLQETHAKRKRDSLELARRLYKTDCLTRTKDNNRAEAILIGLYGLKFVRGGA